MSFVHSSCSHSLHNSPVDHRELSAPQNSTMVPAYTGCNVSDVTRIQNATEGGKQGAWCCPARVQERPGRLSACSGRKQGLQGLQLASHPSQLIKGPETPDTDNPTAAPDTHGRQMLTPQLTQLEFALVPARNQRTGIEKA